MKDIPVRGKQFEREKCKKDVSEGCPKNRITLKLKIKARVRGLFELVFEMLCVMCI